MRILHWCELYRPWIGGVEILLEQLVAAQSAQGHECLIVTSHGGTKHPDVEVMGAAEVHRFRFQHALAEKDVAAIAKLRREIANLFATAEVDVVHLHTLQPSLFFYESSIARRPPTVLSVHEPWEGNDPTRSLALRAMMRADAVVAVSQDLEQRLRRSLPAVADKLVAIPNGLPPPSPASLPDAAPDQIGQRLGIAAAGRLVAPKGFDTLLRAMSVVHLRLPEARLVIAGDGPQRQQLEKLSNELGLESCVEITGWQSQDQVYDLFRQAQVVVVPSRWQEPFGLVALQAAQLATPAVVTKVGALPEVVLHEETGVVCEPENPNDMAEAIIGLLLEPARAQRLGQQAKQRAEQLYGIERMTEDYEEVYQRVCAAGVSA